jgi:uncharacterized protein (TIGR03437 family)
MQYTRLWLSLLAIASAAVAQPTISGIVNASGYQTKLAPDTVFVVFGANMGPASIAIANAPDYPPALAGTSITFTPSAGGAAITAKMVYSLAGQAAGLLPSSIAPGTYAARVTFNGQTSAPVNVTVVARSFGIATANSAGSGPAQATIGNVNGGISLTRFTPGSVAFNGYNWTLGPAHPGDSLVFWGTGGGADPANDTGGTSGDQTAAGRFSVTVGSRQITPAYAGASSGYPGLWQINFTLPSDIAPDCFAFAQVSAGGELSNGVSIPIAAPGQSACSDPQLSQSTLARLDAGGSIVFGGFAAARVTTISSAGTTTGDSISGVFARYTAAEWIIRLAGPRFGPCWVYDRSYATPGGQDPGTPEAFLDAGTRLPLTGPGIPAGAGLGMSVLSLGPYYGFAPAAGGTLASGTYKLTGTGGRDVGPFSASTTFPGSFTVTNLGAITAINRTGPLTINWTGTGFDRIGILVTGSTFTKPIVRNVTIQCDVPAAPGTFTVPAEALAYLQPAPAGSTTAFGSMTVQTASSVGGTFTANLTAGGQIDAGNFTGAVNFTKSLPIN